MQDPTRLVLLGTPLFAGMILITGCGGGGNDSGAPATMVLTASVVTPSQVNLSWTLPPDVVSGYHVLRNGIQITQTLLGSPPYPDRSASPSTNYCYQILSLVFPVGTTHQSNTVCVTTPGTAPGWVTTSLTGANEPAYLALALDSAKKAHLSFFNAATADLMYATNDTGGWQVETVESLGDVGRFNSIALDQAAKTHITYYDLTNNRLRYATNASGVWVISTVADNGGTHTDLAIDTTGKVHISYAAESIIGSTISYATNASGAWVSTFLAGFGSGPVTGTSLVLDSTQKIHVTYQVDTALRYATNLSGIWSDTILDVSANPQSVSASAIDSANRLSISYWHNPPFELRRATNGAGFWTSEVVDNPDWFGLHTSLAIDSADAVHIAYEDANLDLKYATNRTGSWKTQFVDSAGNVGRYNSISIDSAGQVHIAYFDATNGMIKYVVK